METSLRDQIADFVRREYKIAPAYPWLRHPDYAVFRHTDNAKVFGFVTTVQREKLGCSGEGICELLTVKVRDALLADLLASQAGFFPGYYNRRGNWISILLDGSVPLDEITAWLSESYKLTASSATKKALRDPKEWIVPANPKYYDIEAAFDEAEEIDWKQGAGIKKDDILYMYVAAPVSAILYQCIVTATDIPFFLDEGGVHIRSLMRIRLLRRYRRDQFTFEILGRDYGIFAVRGPRGVPETLSQALNL